MIGMGREGEGRESRSGIRTRRKAGMIQWSKGNKGGKSESKKRDDVGQLEVFRSFWSQVSVHPNSFPRF